MLWARGKAWLSGSVTCLTGPLLSLVPADSRDCQGSGRNLGGSRNSMS
jgi:hypothetical protein